MKVTMIGCDNPNCSSVGYPEDGGTMKKPLPPYGWLWIKEGLFMGPGPRFTDLMVCSLDCLAPAIDFIDRQQGEET